MAEALVAGAVLSAVFNVLIEKMASKEVVDFFKQRKLNDRVLGKLKTTMNTVSGLLEDAEEKQITKPSVRNWLDDLKDVAYDADDFLDEIAYKAREKQHLEASPKTCSHQVRNFLSSINPCKKGIREPQHELEKILASIEELLQGNDNLNLEKRNGSTLIPLTRRVKTSVVDESHIYGRDGDKEIIVNLLLSDDAAGSTCPGVVSVVGMGGIGKTSLAQHVFDDSRVKETFHKFKVWVCVSVEMDVYKLSKNILKEIDGPQGNLQNYDSMTPNQLQDELQKKVEGKRFLFVMDDVWNKIDWHTLLKPLQSVARGSKILVTTRHGNVLSEVNGVSSHQLKVLNEEDCWALFAKYAFGSPSSEVNADLKELGTKIISKCQGLPLAVRTIGSLLCSEKRAREWEKILESNIWDLDNVIPALKLSYHYLPSHLKQCFAYCAMFPKDFEFGKEELILLWMAEGFIGQHSNKSREMEEIGEEYFEDLLSRSFFQKHERYVNTFVMHDLLNDLAKSIAGEFCYNNVDANSSKLTEKTRHLLYEVYESEVLEELENISKAKCLHTFICSIEETECRYVVNVLPRFGRLRALDLSGDSSFVEEEDGINVSHLDSCVKHLRYLKLNQLPILNIPETMPYLQTLIMYDCPNLTSLLDSIGDMKDLRHLTLVKIRIKLLPDSICNLKELRHLSLCKCKQLVKLPAKMSDLVNLCHLDIKDTKLKSMPPQMGKLMKLQTLSDFIVGEEEGSGIAELGYLRNLEGSLCLRDLQNVRDEQDGLKAKIKVKSCLEELKYVWELEDDNNSGNIDRSLLQHLEPHMNIKSIDIKGYRGIDFPKWVGDSSFSNIVQLRLFDCKYCTRLPPLGQLASLQNLSIIGFDSLVSVGAEFYGSSNTIQPFMSLTRLSLNRMPKLQQWSSYENETEEDDFTAFPLLEDLTISNCPDLEMAPIQAIFPSTLKYLDIKGCNKISSVHWDLHKSSSLLDFDISSVEDIESFPGMILLPSTLLSIGIDDLQNLKSLDYAGFHHLTSLTELYIEGCPNLECIPDEGLPESLTYLDISGCPLLEERCRKEQGEYWPKIARIQLIYIDGEKIQGTEAIEELSSSEPSSSGMAFFTFHLAESGHKKPSKNETGSMEKTLFLLNFCR